jgi:RNase H-fold protein (predicted Holliday junction resolvase)
VWSKKLSSKNEHEWIGAGLKNEVKKNERTMSVGTKTISIFLCKERRGLCFGLTAFKYTSIVIQKLNQILNIRYNKKKSHQVVVGDKHESKIFQHEKSKPKYWTWIALNDK